MSKVVFPAQASIEVQRNFYVRFKPFLSLDQIAIRPDSS